MRPIKQFVLALICGLLSSCGTHSSLPQLPAADAQSRYTLGSGDRLRITVYGEEKLSGEYVVDGSGSISFPLLATVSAKGATTSELAEKIRSLLQNGFMDNPSVAIDVLNFRPFYILGEVNKAGEYPFAEGLTVFSAVAKAQGFTYRADEKKVYIRHKDEAAERLYRLDGSTPVQPGDTIRILERRF